MSLLHYCMLVLRPCQCFSVNRGEAALQLLRLLMHSNRKAPQVAAGLGEEST